MTPAPETGQKALRINLDGERFGTFAEIGAGQEVVRWFFHAGHAAATIAKSISAYDTMISDDLYGPAEHYVSRERLASMLDHEYTLLVKEQDSKRGDKSCFFVFAETVATHSRPHEAGGHGWMGIRFQTKARSQPSEIIVHVQLFDPMTTGEQEALGILGVNLIHGAFYSTQEPAQLIGELMDGLTRQRIEVDMIKFSGPAFPGIDNRLMSLQLVEQALTDSAMFTAQGDVIQPSEALSGRPVLIERGSFHPVTNVTLDILQSALAQFRADPKIGGQEPVVVMEMTLHNLLAGGGIDHRDFLDRADTLAALGRMVMISNHTRFDRVIRDLRHYTGNWIVMATGLPTLREIFDEKYYTELAGGILEGLGRLFQGAVKLYIYPEQNLADGAMTTADKLEVAPHLRHLYAYLVDNGYIEPIRRFGTEQLHVFPGSVLSLIQSGDASWEKLVPAPVAELIKKEKLFGFRGKR